MIIAPANLHIESTGTGPNLVLLHGWGMHGAVWQPLVKKLSKIFTLHLVDLPGMGL
ncbi:MAG: alpha/beta fold hydrolase, partial [Methylotenera sp.]